MWNLYVWGLTNNWTDSVREIYCYSPLVIAVNFRVLAFWFYISAMPGNIAGSHFPKTLPLLSSHYSKSLEVIQNETFWSSILVEEPEKITWGEIRWALCIFQHWYLFSGQKSLYQKLYVEGALSAYNIHLSGTVTNVPQLKVECLVDCFGRTNSQWIIPLILKEQSSIIFTLILIFILHF